MSNVVAISPTTREQIKAYLEVFIDNLVERYRGRGIRTFKRPAGYLAETDPDGHLKPFHAAMISPELQRISQFERGFSSGLGTTFEECAVLIARQHHDEAHRSYDVTGEVGLVALQEINNQVSLLDRPAAIRRPRLSMQEMVHAVLQAGTVEDTEVRSARADLYIRAKDGTKYFFEIKSPQPNKGQCLEVTERLLRFHLLTGEPGPGVQAYYAMAYNPYGPEREDYKWSLALNYTPFDEGVLIGEEFWRIVGGPTAYEELLAIYQEVGAQKGKYMVDALAFGF